jgi:NAD(P)-dependent dehydrogenase (short-subunit alcohol dehydrogenase family)
MRTSAIYCASKAALEMAVRVASRELAPLGWRVNAVAPGKVADTPMTSYVDQRVMEIRGWTEEQASEYERQSSPLGRMVTKEEVADVILNVLNGPQAQTGEIIAVNGGR